MSEVESLLTPEWEALGIPEGDEELEDAAPEHRAGADELDLEDGDS